MPYLFYNRLSWRLVLSIIAAMMSVFFLGLMTTNGTAAAASCYKMVGNNTIEYYETKSCAQVTNSDTPTGEYKSTNGTTFTGPRVRAGTPPNQQLCSPGTNIITLGSNSASLEKQATTAYPVSCLPLVAGQTKFPTSTISINGWTGSAQNPGTGGENGEEGEEEETSSCAVDGIGWLVCPVMGFIAGITEQSYDIVKAMLETSPSMFNRSTPAGQATYDVWSIMRSIANVAFVISFLIIIYSQLTSFGISNYGVKKMLPRLIIAAILMNLSFFICAVAVDISNILGSSLKGALDSVTAGINITAEDTGWDSAWNGNDPPQWSGLVAFVLATSALVYAGMSVLLPIGIAALAAIVTVVVVLALRQALIILLVVISPLAFVAFLLPNTEGWFKKWRGFFFTMLLMFPAIALIFGASALAGKIVMGSADSDNELVKTAIQIMGAGITIIPLFITPVVMKAAGGVLNRFAGIVNNSDKGVFDRMRKGADRIRKDELGRKSMRALNGNPKNPWGALRRRKARVEAVSSGIKRETKRAQAGYLADKVGKDEAFRERLAGASAFVGADKDALKRAEANALDTKFQLEEEEVKQTVVRMRAGKDDRDMIELIAKELENANASGDAIAARAAQKILLGSGTKGISKLEETLSSIEQSDTGLNKEVSRELRSDLNAAGLKPKNNVLAAWSYDGKERDLKTIANDAGTFNTLNPVELAGQNEKNIERAIGSGAVSQDMAAAVLGNQQASQFLNEIKIKALNEAAGIASPASTSSSGSQPQPQPQVQPQQQQQPQQSFEPTQGLNPNRANTFAGGEETTSSGFVVPRNRKR